MKIVLHIGHSKTGTSSIQSSLFYSRAALRESGVLYPDFAQAHHLLYAAFAAETDHLPPGVTLSDDPSEVRERANSKVAEIARASHDYDTLILSSEHLFHLPADGVERLAQWAQSLGEPRVIVYFRAPVPSAESRIQQGVKIGNIRLEEALQKTRPLPFRKLIPPWINAFSKANITAREFKASAMLNGDALDDFLHVAGLEARHHLIKPHRSNDSFSHPAVILADLLPRPHSVPLAKVKGEKFRVPPDVAARIAAEGEAEVEYLNAEFGISLSNPEYPGTDNPYGVTEETFASLAHILAQR